MDALTQAFGASGCQGAVEAQPDLLVRVLEFDADREFGSGFLVGDFFPQLNREPALP